MIDFYDSIPSQLKYILCIIPNVAFNFALKIIFQFERSSKHFDITNLFTNLYGDALNLGLIWVFMLFWSLVYMPLIWYFEKILPGQFGVPLPFYFVFLPSYWMEKLGLRRADRTVDYSISHSTLRSPPPLSVDRYFFQPEPIDLPATVCLKNISKVINGR